MFHGVCCPFREINLIWDANFVSSAPSVSNERLPAGAEVATAFGKLARFMNIGTPAAVISYDVALLLYPWSHTENDEILTPRDEIGGCNGQNHTYCSDCIAQILWDRHTTHASGRTPWCPCHRWWSDGKGLPVRFVSTSLSCSPETISPEKEYVAGSSSILRPSIFFF